MIELDFKIGDEVFLKTDKDQSKRIVTGILIRESGRQFAVTCGTSENWHFGFEMTKEIDVLQTFK